jgi:hypothetical protein
MKLSLYEISRYTDSKLYYITRLQSVSDQGSIQRVVVSDQVKTLVEARRLLRRFMAHGLRPVSTLSQFRTVETANGTFYKDLTE